MTSNTYLSFLTFFVYQIFIVRGDTTRCPIKFADITTHRNFDANEFQGTWYTQLHTLFVKEDVWDSQTLTFEPNDDGLVNAKYYGFSWKTKKCQNVNRVGMRSPSPGYYIFRSPEDVMHMKVVFTEYENAVVYTCNTDLSDGDCPKNQSQIDIISRDQHLPPFGVLRRLKSHMTDITCIDAVNIDETSQGLCDPDIKIQNANINKEIITAPVRPIPMNTVETTTTIEITWSTPRDYYVNVDNYTISYGLSVLTLDNNVVVIGDTNYVLLSNLDPDTQYIIEIKGHNDIGDGAAVYIKRKTKPKEKKTTYEGKAFTSAPIQLNVVPHLDNPVNVLLSWKHPEQAVGIISNYKIEYCKLNCVHKTRLNVTGHQTWIDVTNLRYDTVYQFFVKACTAFECGAVTSTTYMSPDKCTAHEHSLPATFTKSDLIGTWHTISRTRYVQKDAATGSTRYQFSLGVNGSLTAVYSAMYGGVCKTKDATKLTELNHGIYELDRPIGANSKHKGTLIIAYIDDKFAVVEGCLSQSLNDKSCEKTKHVEIWSKDMNQISIPMANKLERFVSEKLCTPVTDLYPVETVDVCPMSKETKKIDVDDQDTDASSDDHSAAVEVLAMNSKVFTSAPRDVTAAVANGDSTKVVITWTYPEYSIGLVTDYTIQYCTLLCDKQNTYTVQGDVTSLTITGLHYNTVYQISVKACTLFDCGPVSSITYWTPEKCIPVANDSKLTQGSTIGIWYTHSTTTYIWKEKTWTSDIRKFERNDDGKLTLDLTAKSGGKCNPVVKFNLIQSTTGSLVYEGQFKVHTTFVYNDDQYAIVDMCFEDLVDGRCDISKRQVQIWSRKAEIIPLEMEQKLQEIISRKMCIPLADFIDTDPGQCTLPDDNKIAVVQPGPQDTQEKCVPARIDSTLTHGSVTGIWHTISTTTYIWKEKTWTSDIRKLVRSDEGKLSMIFTAKSGDKCNPVVTYNLVEPTTGSLVSEGEFKFHTTFVYNDDKYAIVDMCFEDLVNGGCDISKRQVQIWSRKAEVLPLEMEQKLQDVVNKEMCIPLDDVIDSNPGQCTLPKDNKITAVEPAQKDKQGGCMPIKQLNNANFKGENFVGQWFTLSRTAYASKSLMWESAVQKFVLGKDGDYKVFYTAEVIKSCLPLMVFNLTFVKPGEYEFDFVLDESFTGYTKIIYTDYTYAVVDICNAALVNDKCDHSRRQVEIWSKRKDITPEMKKKLGQIIKEELCIAVTDLIDTSPGKCVVKDEGANTKGMPVGTTPSTKCSKIVDDIPVQYPLDMNMLIGSWNVIETTERNISSGNITFVKNSEDSLISILHINRKKDGFCEEENHTTVIRRKCTLNDGNFFITTKFMNMYHQWFTYKVLSVDNSTAVIYKCSKEDIHGACAVEGASVYIISKMKEVSSSDLQKVYTLLTGVCIDPSSLSKLDERCPKLNKGPTVKTAVIPLQDSQSMPCVVSQLSSVNISDFSKITGLWYAAYIPSDSMDPWESGSMSFTKQGSNDILLKYAGSRNGTHCVGPYEMDIIDVCPCCSGTNYVCRLRSPMLWSLSPWKVLYLDDAVMVNYACLDLEVDGTCSTHGKKLHILTRNGVLLPSERDRIFSTVVKSACVDSSRLKDIQNGSKSVDCSNRLL